MRHCRSLISSALLASSLAFLAAPAVAHEGTHRGSHGDYWEHRTEHMKQDQQKLHAALKLKPEQEGAWQKLVDSEMPMTRRSSGKSEDWAKLTAPERADRMLERMKERQERMTTHVAALKDFYAVLTPEQQKTFDGFHAGMRHGMRHGTRHGMSDKAESHPRAAPKTP